MSFDWDLSEVVGTLTKEQFDRFREEDPVHVVRSEQGGTIND